MEDLFNACIRLGRGYDFEEEHSRQDARLAVRLFDLTADLHHLDDECRDLLKAAGLLHDIGYWLTGYSRHHKSSYELIMDAEWPMLSERETRIMANVARYHRGAKPGLTHQNFAALDEDDQEVVALLGALLRLADGLDRSHYDAVRDVDVWLEQNPRSGGQERLVVSVDCPFGCDAEVWAGEKKGRWLGELLGLEVVVRPQTPYR
jgi:exopolyphosphatase/guanosine-5'-triphosphate,3'-diphosphate pyrophosphatase